MNGNVPQRLEKILDAYGWEIKTEPWGNLSLYNATPQSSYEVRIETECYPDDSESEIMDSIVSALEKFDASVYAYDNIVGDDIPKLYEMEDIVENARQAEHMCNELIEEISRLIQ